MDIPEWFDIVATRITVSSGGRTIDSIPIVIAKVKQYDGTLTVETLTGVAARLAIRREG